MRYIFPRQFSLHNVFTSRVDARETVQPMKDYTLREQEIVQQQKSLKRKAPSARDADQHLPKRLRGEVMDLVRNLQRRNAQCSYGKLLQHYCPVNNKGFKSLSQNKPSSKGRSRRARSGRPCTAEVSADVTRSGEETLSKEFTNTLRANDPEATHLGQTPQNSIFNLATSHAQVSAFCRASVSHVVPRAFWGEGDTARHNENVFLRNIDRFIRLRRFESMTLHACFQHIKVSLAFDE